MALENWDTARAGLRDAAQDVFSQSIIYRPAIGDPVTTRGIFHAEHEVVQLAGDAQVSSVAPVLDLDSTDWPTWPSQGDGFEIDGTNYEVVDVKPDGHGGAKVMLIIV